MERHRVGGHQYTDPDVLSMIWDARRPVDPRQEVVRRAKELNQRLRDLGQVDDPRERIEILASLVGVQVEAMSEAATETTTREALLYTAADGQRHAFYDPSYSAGRTNFSIAHEIVHTFFPNSTRGARFRNLHTEQSREANELERLCDLGAAELLMPSEEFLEELGGDWGLHAVDRLARRFGSSYEATVFRMATTHPGLATAGLLQFRLRVEEERAMRSGQQQRLFGEDSLPPQVEPKYRRQSFHMSESCGSEHQVHWNKSFAPESCVYQAVEPCVVQQGCEALPNRAAQTGRIEAVRAPYQRDGAGPCHPDVLFLWRAS